MINSFGVPLQIVFWVRGLLPVQPCPSRSNEDMTRAENFLTAIRSRLIIMELVGANLPLRRPIGSCSSRGSHISLHLLNRTYNAFLWPVIVWRMLLMDPVFHRILQLFRQWFWAPPNDNPNLGQIVCILLLTCRRRAIYRTNASRSRPSPA